MASLLHTRAGQHVARSWLPRNGAHRLLLPSLLRQQGGARSMTTNVVAPEAGELCTQLGMQQGCWRIAAVLTTHGTPSPAVGAVDGPPAPLGQAPVFTAFTVYKNKGALSVKPIKPTWEPTPGGGFRLDRCCNTRAAAHAHSSMRGTARTRAAPFICVHAARSCSRAWLHACVAC